MTEKVTGYFNIFESGSNLLDLLDVTYQRLFIATPEDDYYKRMLENIIKVNNNEDEPLCNEKLRKAVVDLREEVDAEHKSNNNNITCDDLYQSPMKNKDVSTINDSVYNESDEKVDMISDSRKQIDQRNDPIKETHIVEVVSTLSIGVGLLEPDIIRIISQDITDLVTHVLTNKSEQLSMKILSPLNTKQSKMFVIGLQCESVGFNRNIVCMSIDSRNSVRNHSRIGPQGVNKDIFSPSKTQLPTC